MQCNAVSITWHAPENLGQPHLHKMRLERQRVLQMQGPKAKQQWDLVTEDLDEESHDFLDTGIQVGRCVCFSQNITR